MSYPINYPTPQNANVQIFSIGGSQSDWVKPQKCSFVFFTVIGAGGNGAGGSGLGGGGGGGSGAITTCLVPAFLIPDVLRVEVSAGGAGSSASSFVRYQLKVNTGYTLLRADSGGNAITTSAGSAAATQATTTFSCAGLYQSISGVSGQNAGSNQSAPSGTFLTGGAGGGNAAFTSAGGTCATNFGYPTLAGGVGTTGGDGRDGVSVISNLLLSQGGSGGGGSNTGSGIGGTGGKGGFGSGGGGGGICTASNSTGGKGGDGLVVIVAW